MEITILGTESFGARGLACMVRTDGRTIVLDPGVALGLMRSGHPPHPAEVAAAERARSAILTALGEATDVVVSHYHGDHIPLASPSPYQLGLEDLPSLDDVTWWCKGPGQISATSLARRRAIEEFLGIPLPNAEGRKDGTIRCSHAMLHGSPRAHRGSVMMTRIEEEEEVFIHASDVQLLNDEAVATIFAWQPTILLVSGPPLYLSRLSMEGRKRAWSNATFLAAIVDTLIIDHHLLRSLNGYDWLRQLRRRSGGRVLCAAEYAGRDPLLLEARRVELFREMPVPEGWHEAYAAGKEAAGAYDLWARDEKVRR